ncbi:putative choloylglycine hydrolase [Neomicrococcus aestuarii]|uniref:Putative choloylglycine hydrolase n=1 Tax=Neomicrococcus aestuarii TaxID=556325 RepID=A0A7W8TTQ8_9MICC|nr:C45 family peptidase [Neomicrococcus aestuarii]MBB5512757.1 putative choloylglycine hydrolase [Neomicrococcus aestuarii]
MTTTHCTTRNSSHHVSSSTNPFAFLTSASGLGDIDWLSANWAAIDWASVDWSAIDWASLYAPQNVEPQHAATPGRTAPNWTAPDWRAASAGREIEIFRIVEGQPGKQWKALFKATKSAYLAWYRSGDVSQRPSLTEAQAQLAAHMPELMPTYRKLVELTGNNPDAARFLTMWNMPAFAPACSQIAFADPSPTLIRNYDYNPDLWERTIYTSAFRGKKVTGTGDCLWGLLDGMNESGLAVSLTFGGRPGSGEGFAIPIVIRYILETASTLEQAREILARIPVAMSYKVTVIDRSGESFTAFVAPGQPAEFSDHPAATNHHGVTPEFPEKAARFRSVERLEHLDGLLSEHREAETTFDEFLEKPLFSTEYSAGFGTLYSVMYRPTEGVAEYRWRGQHWRITHDDDAASRTIIL